MMREYKVIDVHSHPVLNIGTDAPLARQPKWSVEQALALMDKSGIDCSILSVPHAAQKGDERTATDIARRVNETIAEIVCKHPTRFGGLVTLPSRYPDATLRELEYALDVLKMDGVATSSNIHDVYLGDTSFDPWFREMNRRGVTLFIHPWTLSSASATSLGLKFAVLEFMFDTTRMLVNLVLTGAKKRFANIRMISAHAGGTLPFLVPRLESLELYTGHSDHVRMSPDEIREGLASFFFDLTAATSHVQLTGVLDLVPTSQVVFGVDIPFMPEPTIGAAIEAVERYPAFSAADLELITHGNAERLYPALAARLARA
jgi:6-methylsalicylate decarboxylase